MLEINGNDIRISKGDTFDVTFELEGYELTAEDTVIFSVKKTVFSEDVILESKIQSIAGAEIRVKVPANEFAKLEPGNYVYDLCVCSQTLRLTLNFPAKLIVESVVHNDCQN